MNFKPFLKRCMTPVTILVIPHSRSKLLKIKVSLAGLYACIALSIVGAVYVSYLSG